jgi:hypothetical protein
MTHNHASEDEQDILAEGEGFKQRKNKQPESGVELETISRAKKRKKREREKIHSLKAYVTCLS